MTLFVMYFSYFSISLGKKKWTKEMSKHFSKDIQMYNKYMKRYSTMAKLQGNANQTTMRHGITPIDLTIMKIKRVSVK